MDGIGGEGIPSSEMFTGITPMALDALSNSDATSTDVLSDASGSQVAPRRSSRRHRKTAAAVSSIMGDLELDALLSQSQHIEASGGRRTKGDQAVPDQDAGVSSDVEKWVETELLLKLRRTAPFSESSTPKTVADHVEQYAYFAKFRDQSYWHCDWMPGQTILCVNPTMVKNFYKRNPDFVALADQEYACSTTSTGLPSSDDESVEEEGIVSGGRGNPCATPPIVGTKMAVSRLPQQPRQGRCRYFYYVENGVDPHYLFPETVLSIGESFKPTHYVECGRRGNGKKTAVSKPTAQFREVLIKWGGLDEGHATWETVEVSLDHLKTMLPKYRAGGLFPLDLCRRRLLPLFVRRWILQLTEKHFTLIASLCSLHFGTGANPHSPRDRKSPMPNWQAKWTDSQPDYISPRIDRWDGGGGKLHPYQREGVRWLRHSYYQDRNVVLADEMGLGKTMQVIALLYSLLREDQQPGPHLIVAPLSTTTNWQREFAFWAPEMQVVLFTGDRQNRAMMNEFSLRMNKFDIPAFNVLVTSYEMVSVERSILSGFQWNVLVVDEAHRLKNKHTRLFRDLSVTYNANFRCLLTGTPLQNNIDELFHLLSFIDPKKFSDVKTLSSEWSEMSKEERVKRLRCSLEGHLLRRMKRDVIQDLPRKTEIVVPLDLTPLQRRIYKLVLIKNYEELRTRCLINTLIHLQKVCDHPYLMPRGDHIAPRLEDGSYEPAALVNASAKLQMVMRMLPRLRDAGHRVLIFSNLVIMLNLIEMALLNADFLYERIDGSVRGDQRQCAIDRFNARDATPFVFLLSTRAGGEGINLTSADTVILFDSDWNPHRDLQALARAHRIGQSKHVLIYRLIMRSTVEERILQVAQKKLALTKVLMDDPQRGHRDGGGKRGSQTADLLRLSHSEAHKILCTGLDALFAGQADSDADSEEGGGVCDTSGENVTVEPQDVTTRKSTPMEENPDADHQATRDDAIPADRLQTDANYGCTQMTTMETSTETTPVPPVDTAETPLVAADAQDLLVATDGDKPVTLTQPQKPPATTTLVYDDAALERLLDRNQSPDAEEADVGVADDYLSVFKSATFVTTLTESDDKCPLEQDAIDTNCLMVGGTTSSRPEDETGKNTLHALLNEPRVEPAEVARFWENLLGSRYQRLMASECRQQAAKGASRATADTLDALPIVIDDSDSSGHSNAASDDDDDASDNCSPGGGSAIQLVDATAGNETRLSSNMLTKRECIGNDGGTRTHHSNDTLTSNFSQRRRKSARRPRPTALSLAVNSIGQAPSSSAPVASSALAAAARRVSRQRPGAVANRARPRGRDSDAEYRTDDASEEGEEVDDDEDYEVADDDEANADSSDREAITEYQRRVDREAGRTRKNAARRKQPITTDDGRLRRDPPSPDNCRMAAAYQSIDWVEGADEIYSLWRSMSAATPNDVVFEDDDTMTVFGFNAHDRQLFLEAVMRHGLPPKGIVPPPEWLPPTLHCKHPVDLFSYTTLFMRHLYEDPKIIDENALHWSDGLPTEGMSGVAVLSRVAMMTLIRSKVLQYEEINLASRLFTQLEHPSNRFNINEGGLSVIFHTWNQEMDELQTRLQLVPAMATAANAQSSVFGVCSRKWHRIHDFWLLGGIHTYGYAAWSEIIGDDRFKMVPLGLAEIILPLDKADVFARTLTDDDLLQEIRENHSLDPEVFAFLSHRLRLLEQALLVEQSIVQIALAFSGRGTEEAKVTPVPREVSQINNFAKTLSDRLSRMGPLKRIALPTNCRIAEAVRKAIYDLHLLMEDLYADMPGLPGAVVCEGVQFAQPRFLTDTAPAPSVAPPGPAPTHHQESSDRCQSDQGQIGPTEAPNQQSLRPQAGMMSVMRRPPQPQKQRVTKIVIDLVDSD